MIIKNEDLGTKDIADKVNALVNNDRDINDKVIKHFIRVAQDYLVEQGTLRPAQTNTAAIADKVSDASAIDNMHTEHAHTLTTQEATIDSADTSNTCSRCTYY